MELCLQTGKLKELAGLLNDVIGTKRDALEDATTDNQARIAQSKQRLQKANISTELLTRAGQTLI